MIARGGMGEIYLAHLQGVAGFEKTCVIKKIRPELANDPSFVERFLNEGRTLVALTHSNIVQIFDMGQVDDDYYLAMEYVPGEDLRDLMRCQTSKWMPVGLVIAVVQRVLQGLSYAHRAVDSNGQSLGIVHRDISPSNILISTEGEVKLIDFGIAKAKTIESVSGVVQGKFAYMSPEQARGESLDCRTDIFSLGIVLYEMLTGIRPFEGNSDLQSLERIKNIEPKPIHALRRDVDNEFSAILAKALAKDRNERYQTADELYDAIQEYAKQNGFNDGQREIAAYFRPLMQADAKPTGMEDALDAMLEAQAMANLTTATRTITGKKPSESSESSGNATNADDSGHRVADSEPDDKPNGNAVLATDTTNFPSSSGSLKSVSRDDSENVKNAVPADESVHPVSSGNHSSVSREAAEAAVLLAESRHISSSEIAKISLTEQADSLGDAPAITNRDLRHARMKLRIRYGLGGILFFCILCAIAFVIFLNVNSTDNPGELREKLQNLAQKNADPVREKSVWQNPNLISQMPRMFQRGIPFSLITEPETATIYIIEGGYRKLQDKSVIILPDRDVEIAIQAPGYETCIFQVFFNDDNKQDFENISWQNCRAITTNFSVEHQRIEVFVSLNPIRPSAVINAPNPSNSNVLNDVDTTDHDELKPVESPSEPQNKAQIAKDAKPANSEKSKQDSTDKTNRSNHKTADKKQTKPSNTIKTSFKSNVAGNIIIAGQTHHLPAEIESTAGTSWKIVPEVSGRKVAVPAKGTFSDKPIDVSFCNANVGIKQYFVSGDPSPYQLSDIYIDGSKVATHQDSVQLVLPCGTHQLEAKIHEGDVRLHGKMSISVRPDQKNVFPLSLNEEK